MAEYKELIKAKETEFNEILKKHPRKIPLKVMEGFLGVKEENLRIMIKQGRLAGGICNETANEYTAYYIFPCRLLCGISARVYN